MRASTASRSAHRASRPAPSSAWAAFTGVEDTQRAAAELHAAGLGNFNLDLMYALPEQTLEEAITDIREALALEPAHISHYQLALEPGTVFHARPPPLPDEDAAFAIQGECQRLLAESGFEQYEVSAYARRGARCRHNLNYWLFGDYVGVGAGAHGKISLGVPERVLRTEKPKQPRDYLERLRAARAPRLQAAVGERRWVARADLPFEFMLNALRLNEGFATADFEARTGLAMGAAEPTLNAASGRGLVQATADGWRPTRARQPVPERLAGQFPGMSLCTHRFASRLQRYLRDIASALGQMHLLTY